MVPIQQTTFNRQLVEEGARLVLQGLGVDLTDHNFSTTPKRVADVYESLFCPPETNWAVFDEKYTDMVILRNHTFWTCCPHHLLPVKLVASVAYIPNGKVMGASKLMRMLHECNRKPMTQEALTAAAVSEINRLTEGTSLGVAVCMEGAHGCFEIRGVKSNATMVTAKFSGEFEKDVNLRNQFFELVRMGNGR